RNERSAERAFTEQVLQRVREPQTRAKDVGVQRDAEVVGEDTLANQSGDAAEENAEGDERRGGRAPTALLRRNGRFVSVGARYHSAPERTPRYGPRVGVLTADRVRSRVGDRT